MNENTQAIDVKKQDDRIVSIILQKVKKSHYKNASTDKIMDIMDPMQLSI